MHTLDPAQFRLAFPAFADPQVYPDAKLELYWGLGVGYLGAYDGCYLHGPSLQSALNLMTAHLLALADIMAEGVTPAQVTQSKVDKVSVTMEPPPARNGWQWWLALTPYGMQLWALLKLRSAGGFYAGGLPERSAFRKVGGIF